MFWGRGREEGWRDEKQLRTRFTVNGPYTGNDVRERGQRSPRGWYQLMTHHLFEEAEGMGGGPSDPEPKPCAHVGPPGSGELLVKPSECLGKTTKEPSSLVLRCAVCAL